MKCPSCSSQMKAVPFEGIAIDHCTGCFGVWLDDGEVSRVVESHEHSFSPQEREHFLARVGQDREKSGAALCCPKCHESMTILQYAYDTGVFVDRCPNNHGIWLDPGEFQKIQIVMEERQIRAGKSLKQRAGKQLKPLEGSRLAERVCPRDSSHLIEVNYENVRISGCRTCGGFWCQSDDLREIIRRRERTFHRGHWKKAEELNARDREKSHTLTQQSATCPDCKVPMQTVQYDYKSGIFIDRCAQCSGVWLDHSELERVQIFNEKWSEKSEDLRRDFRQLLKKSADEAEARLEKAKADGIRAALGRTAVYRAYDFFFGDSRCDNGSQ